MKELLEYLPMILGAAGLWVIRDLSRTWIEAQARRTEDQFVTRDEFEREQKFLLERCEKNTQALESHAKHAAEQHQKTEARFNAMAIQRGRTV